MLGDTVRDARIRKGLTQAKLARLAGVSRRHLAALEKGANISLLVLRKVAGVLELREISIGELSLRAPADASTLNIALLSDTLREARSGTRRVEAILSRAEGIVAGDSIEPRPASTADGSAVPSFSTHFPRLPVASLDIRRHRTGPTVSGANVLRDDTPGWLEVETAGELRHGGPIDEGKRESLLLPATLVEEGEIVFRVRGDELREHDILDGDLLIVQLRTTGRASTGELAIGRIGDRVYVGRWWQKHGQKALMTDGLAEVTVGPSKRSLKVVAVINQIVRQR